MALLVALLLTVLLLPYLVGPALLRHRTRLARVSRVIALGPEAVPDPVRERIEAWQPALLGIGVRPGPLARLELEPGHPVYVQVHRDEGQRALIVVAIHTRVAGTRLLGLETERVEFTTTWEDGRQVVTTNAPEVPPFAPLRRQAILRLAAVEDVELLARIHAARVAGEQNPDHPVLPDAGMEPQHLRDALEAWTSAQRRRGRLIGVASSMQDMLTWRGACLATWRQLTPIRDVLARRHRARARRLVESLELEMPAQLLDRPEAAPTKTAAATRA